MNLSVRKIVPDDLSNIVALLREFAAFEKLTDYCEVTEKQLDSAMFQGGGFVEGLIAVDGDKATGYALFYPSFASFRGQRGFYLEDLYVDNEYRGLGVGEKLLAEIAATAASRGFERIDFAVLDWNMKAIRFYEKLGAVRDPDERHFKFTDNAFRDLAK